MTPALGALRRLLCLAPVPAGQSPAFLRDRLIVLPLLTVIAFGSLSLAYGDVHGDSSRIADRTGPALVELTRAEVALDQAQKEADSVLQGPELIGLGQTYPTLITRATQNLNEAAQSPALSASQRQGLQVVSGLVVDYNGYIGTADRNRDDPTLKKAYLSYALSMLCETTGGTGGTGGTDGTGGAGTPAGCADRADRTVRGYEATTIQDRIGSLERSLRADLDHEAGWGTGPVTLAAVACAAYVLLAVGLFRTLTFLKARFRLLSLPLAATVLPLLAVPVLVLGSVQVQHGQAAVRRIADGELARVSSAAPAVQLSRTAGTAAAPGSIDELQQRIAGAMRRAHSAGWESVTGFILPAGLLGAAVTGWALLAYRRDYVRVPRREDFR
ncbi:MULTISPECIES: hypothetical protein [unclassified Streptomyces]|uniref:hypothetical protein n=1 Tax=unclassified Streptomyces TaxID=2593676 RepID=UPI002E14DD8C|nr:hypothetical protein OG452_10675 [Streptomyces sp. NBC_01197]WSS51557.1 hypothetical protein OG708_24705 [Streptomyces sp. NBC_01180]